MVTELRNAARSFALLWTGWADVVRRRGATLLLLFLLGWAGYYLAVMFTGVIAPRRAWAVVPLMALGCLVQLIITLTAYRLSIRQAEISLDAPKLPDISFATMISTLLVPFAAAYSAFGFFGNFAKDVGNAAASLVGTGANVSFFNQMNPLDPDNSMASRIGIVAFFVGLWILGRLIKIVAGKHKSMGLTLLGSFVTICSTFVALLSIWNIRLLASDWIGDRVYVTWRDHALSWLQGLVHLDAPRIFATCWDWIAGTAWPIFWYVLSQPLLWLAVVALVGGMQFLSIDTVWGKARKRLGVEEEHLLAEGLAKKAGDSVLSFISGLLPFFHLITVIIRSGVAFLGALIVSFTLVQQIGSWIDYAIQYAIGPTTTQYYFLISPLTHLGTMIIAPMIEAMLLSVAYVRLRQFDDALTVERPTGLSWRPVAAVVLCLAIAIGASRIEPPSPYPSTAMSLGTPVTLLSETVTALDVQVGRSLVQTGQTGGDGETYTSLGVFIQVRASVTGYQQSTIAVAAVTGDGTQYVGWDGSTTLIAQAGFRTTENLVFEVPATSLSDLTIVFQPMETIRSMPVPTGVLTVPPDSPIAAQLTDDTTTVTEVP